jgi:hypothetical protein
MTTHKKTNEEMTETALHECGGEAAFRSVLIGYAGLKQKSLREEIVGQITPKERADLEHFEETYNSLFIPKTALAWLKESAPTEVFLDIPGLKDEEGKDYFVWANTHGVPDHESRIFKMLIVAHFCEEISQAIEVFERECAEAGE